MIGLCHALSPGDGSYCALGTVLCHPGQQGEGRPALLANCHMGCSGVLGMLPGGFGMLGVPVGAPQIHGGFIQDPGPSQSSSLGGMMLVFLCCTSMWCHQLPSSSPSHPTLEIKLLCATQTEEHP